MLKPRLQSHFDHVTEHLYINPLEKCNLRCKICYTRKTSPILSNQQMLDFVERYQAVKTLKTITFCGGEVFALTTFPSLLNILTDKGLFLQIITNGTLDRLDEVTTPNLINLIVSLDGLEEYHDANRGAGNFRKSISFMKKAQGLGFHLDVFSIITQQNLPYLDDLEQFLATEFGQEIPVTYHPRKPLSYLNIHPVSNITGETTGFDFLTKPQMLKLIHTRNVFPPKNLGCYQIALVSDGKVYGCCEGVRPLGMIDHPVTDLLDRLENKVAAWAETDASEGCLGCSDHLFMCGLKELRA